MQPGRCRGGEIPMLIVCRDQSEQMPLYIGTLCQIDVRVYKRRNGNGGGQAAYAANR